jgi:TolB-like protein/DNA-binding winged helix-turn-helix (wHTH) protein/tetratricopeptide (TPR) repeat protein
MQSFSGPPTRLRFGVFEADLRLGELTRSGKRIRLQEQPFRVLAMLLERPGELVTRAELHNELWPQTIVDFDHGLNKAVSKIRDALGDSADNPRFVETIAGRGYRFLADVTPIGEPAVPVTVPQVPLPVAPALPPQPAQEPPPVYNRPEPVPAQSPPHRLRWIASIAIVLLIAVAIGVFWKRTRVPPRLHSLVVLPFQNLSNDPSQEFFADGMTDELITHLGQISALRVISRTSAMSYKSTSKSLTDIARELNVEAVVEGSVLRAGDRVRITAQLIRVPADEHIWAHSYEGEIKDTLALQRDVAGAIVQQVGATLTQPELRALGSSRPVVPEAYEAYLKGRYFWNKRTRDGLDKSIEQFDHAIEMDPTYSPAYSGLADAYSLSGDWEYGILSPQEAAAKSHDAAVKAVSLDDNSAQAHTSLALSLDLYGWEWEAAEKEYQRALQLNPGYATAHQWYAWHLLVTGRTNEGLVELRTAYSQDPLSLIISADLADALCIARLLDESVQQSQRTLDFDPNFALGHYQLGQALAQKGLHDRAIAEFEKAIASGGHADTFDANLAYSLALSGRKPQATAILTNLLARNEQNSSAQSNIALIYVGLGDRDQALAWLDKAYESRFNPSILLRPTFDSLRGEPRFQNLRRKMGLSPSAPR